MKSLHQQVRAKAQHGRVILAQLGPNSRDVAKIMIARVSWLRLVVVMGMF